MSLLGGVSDHFGIDIGTEAIRVAQLSGSGDSFNIEGFGSAPLPSGLSQSDSPVDLEKMAQILTDLLGKSGIDTKNVVAAVPGTSVFNTIVTLPAMPKADMAKAVAFQAEQSIPLKLEDINYDWQVIGQNPQTKETSILIVAATKGKVEQMMKLFELARLDVVAFETASIALSRSLQSQEEPLVMMLDLGAMTTEIVVVANDTLVQTRSIPIGGEAITRAVSQGLRLDKEQANLFKMKFGLSQDKLEGQVYKSSEPIIKGILEEAVRSAKYYQETYGTAIERLILTGGTSQLPLLPEYIKSYMGVEVVFGNPWQKVSYPNSYNEKINELMPYFATALGLAMRR